jgi:hypothetical protein
VEADAANEWSAAMPIEDDHAWQTWNRAVDQLVAAAEEFRGLRHLSETHPSKCDAWSKVKAALAGLDRAAKEIDSEFRHNSR